LFDEEQRNFWIGVETQQIAYAGRYLAFLQLLRASLVWLDLSFSLTRQYWLLKWRNRIVADT
jgi:hypothetical protein